MGGDCATVGNTGGGRSASNQSVLRVERALKTVSSNTVLRVIFYDSEISTFFFGVPGHLTGLCRCLDQMSLSNGGGLRIASSSSRPPSPSSLLGL